MKKLYGIKCYTKRDATKITPIMAEHLLKKNKCIKPIKASDVKKLTKEMTLGKFEWNGASIVLDNRGNLIDGQHRCTACVDSGKPFHAVLIWGVSHSGKLTVDTGRPRNIVQYLAKQGYTNPSLLSNTARIIYAFENADKEDDGTLPIDFSSVTPTDILGVLDTYPDLPISVAKVTECSRELVFKYGRAMLTALDFITRMIEDKPKVADEFLNISAGYLTKSKEHPAYILRSRIIYDIAKRGVQMNKQSEQNTLIKAYNMHKQNLRSRTIKVAVDEKPVVWLYNSMEVK
jgi:hypothetical protein